MTMSNTMICGATKIWYYIPERKSAAFEAWLEATRPGYIESLEAGPERCHAMIVLLKVCQSAAVKMNTSCNSSGILCFHVCLNALSLCIAGLPLNCCQTMLTHHLNVAYCHTQVPTALSPL